MFVVWVGQDDVEAEVASPVEYNEPGEQPSRED